LSVDILLLESINEILALPFNNSKNLWNITDLLISLRIFATCRWNLTLQKDLAVMLIFLQYIWYIYIFFYQGITYVYLLLSQSLSDTLTHVWCFANRISSQIFVKWVTFITWWEQVIPISWKLWISHECNSITYSNINTSGYKQFILPEWNMPQKSSSQNMIRFPFLLCYHLQALQSSKVEKKTHLFPHRKTFFFKCYTTCI